MRPPKNFHPEPFTYHEEVEIEIDQMSNLGSGVGRINGWVMFVPYALPGERVLGRVWRNKKNYSEADLVEVLRPAPERVEPRCSLFRNCGGCQYQHLDYEAQLKWKTRQISDLLKKMAGLEMEVQPCIGSPVTYGYRSKLTPHFRRPPQEDVPIGFQRASSRSIVDVSYCPIASNSINEALPRERDRLRERAHLFKRGGTLLLRDSEEGVVTDMKAIAREKIGEYTFEFVAGEFFQNNPYVLPKLVDYALDEARGTDARYLVDTYCGVGVFAICGHRDFDRVAGVELSSLAIERANRNAEINHVENVDFVLGNAESVFGNLEFPGAESVVVIDPPRRGCDESFITQVVEFGPCRLVYVSCGPDTQARDTKLLGELGYEVLKVQPFDLFPQTRHIENVITLEPVKA